MIALPTDAEHVKDFEKTLIGGFSCINNTLDFDTQILLNAKTNEEVLFNLDIDKKKKKTNKKNFNKNIENGPKKSVWASDD